MTEVNNIVSKGRGESSKEHAEMGSGVPTLLAGIVTFMGRLWERPEFPILKDTGMTGANGLPCHIFHSIMMKPRYKFPHHIHCKTTLCIFKRVNSEQHNIKSMSITCLICESFR